MIDKEQIAINYFKEHGSKQVWESKTFYYLHTENLGGVIYCVEEDQWEIGDRLDYVGNWNDNPDKIVGLLADIFPNLAREFLNSSAFGESMTSAEKRFESNKLEIDEEISRGLRGTKHRFTI